MGGLMITNLKINEACKRTYYERGYWTASTLYDAWEKSARDFAGRTYVKDGTTSLTYAQVDDKAGRVARWLVSIGVANGDVVTIQLPKWAEFTIAYVACLKVGAVMSAGFDQIFNLYNSATMDRLDIIDTYVYRLGIESNRYSYSTAVGLFKNVINLLLVLLTNAFAKKIGQTGLF